MRACRAHHVVLAHLRTLRLCLRGSLQGRLCPVKLGVKCTDCIWLPQVLCSARAIALKHSDSRAPAALTARAPRAWWQTRSACMPLHSGAAIRIIPAAITRPAQQATGLTSTMGMPISCSRRLQSSLCSRVTRTVRLLYLATSSAVPVCTARFAQACEQHGSAQVSWACA